MSQSETEARIARFLEIDKKPDTSPAMSQLQAKAVEDNKKLLSVSDRIAEKLEKKMKPLGFYNIPEKLDNRRLEYGIPNGAFEVFPAFDRVYIHQIPESESRFLGDSQLILKTEHAQSVERNITPRGILVAAGLQARDCLSSSGIEVGDIVKFQKMAPFNMTVDNIDGTDLKVMVLRDGDIVGSEDLATSVNGRTAEIVNVSEDSYDYRVKRGDQSTGKKKAAYYDPSM